MASVLDLLHLTDSYERKARLLPALISGASLLPAIATASGSWLSWLLAIPIGIGAGAIFAVGISYVASAAGRAYERQTWHPWPDNAPTHRWLRPDDITCSKQQKEIWYDRIKIVSGLDIPTAAATGEVELNRVINDAVRSIRDRIRNSPVARMVSIHNEDYGFARNLAGLRPLWLPGSTASAIVTWAAFAIGETSLAWPVIATAAFGIALIALAVLPRFVRDRGERYAESLFGALEQLPTAGASSPLSKG